MSTTSVTSWLYTSIGLVNSETLVVVPNPSCPLVFRPQVYRVPSFKRTATELLFASMSITSVITSPFAEYFSSLISLFIVLGVSPFCPFTFVPQYLTIPSCDNV